MSVIKGGNRIVFSQNKSEIETRRSLHFLGYKGASKIMAEFAVLMSEKEVNEKIIENINSNNPSRTKIKSYSNRELEAITIGKRTFEVTRKVEKQENGLLSIEQSLLHTLREDDIHTGYKRELNGINVADNMVYLDVVKNGVNQIGASFDIATGIMIVLTALSEDILQNHQIYDIRK